jgi:hypothetical protein
LDLLIKSVLKRQLPYIMGGTVTGIIITYYYGFLFSIMVNSAIWFAISSIVNKYYWKYTGFKEEMLLLSKYIGHVQNKDSKNNIITKVDFKKEINIPKNSVSIDIDKEKIENDGNHLKF